MLVVWLQDAIWKTFQSRIESRLLELEQGLSSANSEKGDSLAVEAFQFNSAYLKDRPSTIGLILEYMKQAARPTVAFPHVVLLVLLVAYSVCG